MAHNALGGSTGEHVRASVKPDDRPTLEFYAHRLRSVSYLSGHVIYHGEHAVSLRWEAMRTRM
jgi:hypothetical protein